MLQKDDMCVIINKDKFYFAIMILGGYMSLELIVCGVVLMISCGVIAALFLRAFYREEFVKALIFKGAASLCFVVFAAFSLFSDDPSVSAILVFIGLVLGMIGDELIALCQVFPKWDFQAFFFGGVSFLIGHVLYIVGLLLLGEANWLAIIISLALLSSIGGIYARYRRFLEGKMGLILTLYLGIVILVTSVAFGSFLEGGSVGSALFILGGLLFMVSDNILFAYKFGERPRFMQNIVLHATYYLAQFAIAWSIAWL